MPYDLMIKGGRIYDGSGMPSYLGDVAVKDGRIVEVGRLNGSADRRVSADGLIVASIFGLHDRGLIRPRLAADLVLFDPRTVGDCEPEMASDLPGGEKRLIQSARGIEMTVVNGEILVANGKHTGALLGRVVGGANGAPA